VIGDGEFESKVEAALPLDARRSLESGSHFILNLIGLAALVLGFLAGATGSASPQDATVPYTIVGDAIPASLTGSTGDANRGRAIVANRQVGLCLMCHSGPLPEVKLQGNLAPDLKGAGTRWNEGQLRLRIVDASEINPDTIMPPYYRVDGLVRVANSFRNQPILTAEQIEDVVAYLVTLRD
jgi:L-cysteine S-thiosulfotransferase